jgi:hypothetical protein
VDCSLSTKRKTEQRSTPFDTREQAEKHAAELRRTHEVIRIGQIAAREQPIRPICF